MSHLKEYNANTGSTDGRSLGDEWADWDGNVNEAVREGKTLFLSVFGGIVLILNLVLFLLVYLIEPRLGQFTSWLPQVVWVGAALFTSLSIFLYFVLIITVTTNRNLFPSRKIAGILFDLYFSKVFWLAKIFNISRDRIGHSFIRVSNALSCALKSRRREEKVLILLPRCLSKEGLKKINELKDVYPIEIHTVSGGELARKRVKELKPTAVIGVACERDLVSGIRDVGQKISVIGIPNERPEGPCKNTRIDIQELISVIELYVKPTIPQRCL